MTYSYDALDPKPPTRMYKSMDSLFMGMLSHRRAHPGVVFEVADRRLDKCVGFWDPATGASWHIDIYHLGLARVDGDRRVGLVWTHRQRRELLAEKLSQGVVPTRGDPPIEEPVGSEHDSQRLRPVGHQA